MAGTREDGLATLREDVTSTPQSMTSAERCSSMSSLDSDALPSDGRCELASKFHDVAMQEELAGIGPCPVDDEALWGAGEDSICSLLALVNDSEEVAPPALKDFDDRASSALGESSDKALSALSQSGDKASCILDDPGDKAWPALGEFGDEGAHSQQRPQNPSATLEVVQESLQSIRKELHAELGDDPRLKKIHLLLSASIESLARKRPRESEHDDSGRSSKLQRTFDFDFPSSILSDCDTDLDGQRIETAPADATGDQLDRICVLLDEGDAQASEDEALCARAEGPDTQDGRPGGVSSSPSSAQDEMMSTNPPSKGIAETDLMAFLDEGDLMGGSKTARAESVQARFPPEDASVEAENEERAPLDMSTPDWGQLSDLSAFGGTAVAQEAGEAYDEPSLWTILNLCALLNKCTIRAPGATGDTMLDVGAISSGQEDPVEACRRFAKQTNTFSAVIRICSLSDVALESGQLLVMSTALEQNPTVLEVVQFGNSCDGDGNKARPRSPVVLESRGGREKVAPARCLQLAGPRAPEMLLLVLQQHGECAVQVATPWEPSDFTSKSDSFALAHSHKADDFTGKRARFGGGTRPGSAEGQPCSREKPREVYETFGYNVALIFCLRFVPVKDEDRSGKERESFLSLVGLQGCRSSRLRSLAVQVLLELERRMKEALEIRLGVVLKGPAKQHVWNAFDWLALSLPSDPAFVQSLGQHEAAPFVARPPGEAAALSAEAFGIEKMSLVGWKREAEWKHIFQSVWKATVAKMRDGMKVDRAISTSWDEPSNGKQKNGEPKSWRQTLKSLLDKSKKEKEARKEISDKVPMGMLPSPSPQSKRKRKAASVECSEAESLPTNTEKRRRLTEPVLNGVYYLLFERLLDPSNATPSSRTSLLQILLYCLREQGVEPGKDHVSLSLLGHDQSVGGAGQTQDGLGYPDEKAFVAIERELDSLFRQAVQRNMPRHAPDEWCRMLKRVCGLLRIRDRLSALAVDPKKRRKGDLGKGLSDMLAESFLER
eukprot:scaffold1237_cov243-Pinguiococcus_pyrenoidosus.AAC.7